MSDSVNFTEVKSTSQTKTSIASCMMKRLLFLLSALLFALPVAALNLTYIVHDYKSSVKLWRKEIQHSIASNVINCKCHRALLGQLFNSSYLLSGAGDYDDQHCWLSYNLPAHDDDDLRDFRRFPSTLTRANSELYSVGSKRGYSTQDWGSKGPYRWEIPTDHEGQDRMNCINQTIFASLGSKSRFYDSYRRVNRIGYLLYFKHAYIHPTGLVGMQCGYYKGTEGCETRWGMAREWWEKCTKYMQLNGLTWKSLWSDDGDNTDLLLACADSTPQAVHLNKSSVPQQYNRVIVAAALWDFNYHHFMADSLARLAKYISFLRRHTDIMIHIRGFEEYDTDLIGLDGEMKVKRRAKMMRDRMFSFLGIDPARIIFGPVLANEVFIPRALHCSYTLSNPLEILALSKLVIRASLRKLSRGGSHSGSIKRNIILQQRSNKYEDPRDWTNQTFMRVVEAFRNVFADHNVVMMPSRDESQDGYCLECAMADYQRADVLVGMHGAGLTNMMFMPPGALIVELVGEFTDVNMPLCGYYGTLAAVMGHHHYLFAYPWGSKDLPHGGGWSEFDPLVPARESHMFYMELRSATAQLS